MKRILSFALSIALMLSLFALPVYAATPEPTRMTSESYMLFDLRTGKILLQNNIDAELEPASITKMITAIIAIEEMDLERTLVADAEVANTPPTTLSLKDGEEIRAIDALNAMLVASCNDCAILFAKAISGSSAAFAEKMNQKLLEIDGVKHTNFVNPNGFHDEGHYTTASDLYYITLYCMKNDLFREIVAKSEYTVPKTNKSDARTIVSTNSMLADDTTMMYVYNEKVSTKYEGTMGVKTGYTSEAGHCIVAAAEQNGTQLCCIVLKSPTSLERYVDAHKLLNWGFENYYSYKAVESGTSAGAIAVKRGSVKEVELRTSGEFYTLLPSEASSSVITTETHLNEGVTAPVAEGTKLGYVDILEGGEKIGSVDVVAAQSVEKGGPLSIFGIDDATAHKIKVGIISAICIIVGGFVAWVFWARHQTKVKKARKAAKIKALKEEEARRRAMWERDYESRRNDRE